MTGPQVKSSKPPKLPTQVTNKDEKVFKFEKEKHQLIYRTFLDIFKNPEKLEEQTKQEIEKKKQKLKEKQKLQSDLKSLKERLPRLQDENEKKIFTFISKNHEGIFKNINQEDIKLLSEENFLQFLVSVSKKIKKENLANEENLENGKIKQVVNDCIADIRKTEAKDSLIKLLGWPFGIKVDPKNISSSFMNGVKEKIPFLGKDKKEEDEPPLSDEEMVTTFLRKIFLPILFSIASISIFGPTTLAVVVAAIGAIFAIKGGVGVLFSNNKKGTLYDPNSQDKNDTEKRAKLNGKILEGIDDILKTPVTEVEKGTSVSEQISQGKEKSEQQPVPEQISQVGNEKSEQRDQSWTGKENKRREKPQNSKGKTTQVC
ncbi:hypothetical protein [Wolbachia endosymbiont (group A) of Cheilosia soror]|uniref:hypothetical protein n=1 Tax=Wolbachia endosymbiont (group A) of Cheilosia soror TaxID=2953995 RepID=UPI0021F8AA43|nr:hypothetical protein [Wolbachia endosymbiont (group A) of Cheilosia soror]